MRIGIAHPDNPHIDKNDYSSDDFFKVLIPEKQNNWIRLINPFFKKAFIGGTEFYRQDIWKCSFMGAGLSAITTHINLLEFCFREKLNDWRPKGGMKSLIDKAANKDIISTDFSKELKEWYDEIGNNLRHQNAIELGKLIYGHLISVDLDTGEKFNHDLKEFIDDPVYVWGTISTICLKYTSDYIANVLEENELVTLLS